MNERDRIAAHEAGHAAACVALGVPVRLVDVQGDATTLGRCDHGLVDIRSPEDARKRMLIILAGLIEGAEDWDEMPSWPLQSHLSTDERNLKGLAEYLGLDRFGYSKVEMEALHLTSDRFFRMLHVAVTGMLDHLPTIGEPMIRELVQMTRDITEN